MPGDRETALAIVHTRKGQAPLIRHCAVHPIFEIRPEHVLLPLNHARELARAPVSGVIHPNDYQLLQVEAPEVPSDEMRAAVRWKLRDVINFPLNEAIIDVFEIPNQSRYAQARMAFVVAARGSAVERVVTLIKPRVRGSDVVDIPELCLRNLSALLPQDERGVALLVLGDTFAQLVLTRQGTLYLARRIELGESREAPGSDAEGGDEMARGLALELQRSLDYYESHYDQPPISALVIASGDERAERFAVQLKAETGVAIELFDLQQHFDFADTVEPDTRWPALVALGAALRTAHQGE
jgi:MSHA biogenesis protein MshI